MNLSTQNLSELNTLPYGGSFYSNSHIKPGIERESVNNDEFILLSNWVPDKQNKEVISNQAEDVSHLQIGIREDDFSFRIELPDFNYNFYLEIINLEGNLSSDSITFYLSLDKRIVIKAVLKGHWKQDETFNLENFGLTLEKKQESPISTFLYSTLWTMLGLSTKFKVYIPEINFDLTTSFKLSFKEISRLLQERQIAYRLMVIEQALRISLPFPNGYISGDDVEAIAFCYHAIVDREFDWFANPTIIPWQSSEESLSWLPRSKKPTSITFRPEPVIKSIFGIKVNLGLMTVRIDKAVIDNYEEVKEELSNLDGSIVNVNLRSITGISRVISLRVPELSQNPWSEDLEELINIDSKLDSLVLQRFFNSAASTLKGLTEEQKEAIMKRPDLNEKALET